MLEQTKIQLLPAEMELVSSPDIILTKNAILKKIKTFFEEIQFKQLEIVKRYFDKLPHEVLKISPKISRGENYLGLPWLVLDNPRFFEQKHIFAIRTMFWWGNFFSITLHLSGRYKKLLSLNIPENYKQLCSGDFYIHVGQEEWAHNLADEHNKKIAAISMNEMKQIIAASEFLKIAVKFPISPLASIEGELCRNYEVLIKCCS